MKLELIEFQRISPVRLELTAEVLKAIRVLALNNYPVSMYAEVIQFHNKLSYLYLEGS